MHGHSQAKQVDVSGQNDQMSPNDFLCPCQICIIHVHVHATVTLENVGFSLHVLAIGTTQDAYIHIPINSSDALMCMCWLG